MKLLSAILDEDRADLHLTIQTDDADPDAVRAVTYGDQPRLPGETRAAYRNRLDKLVKGALKEERLLIRAEQRRNRKPDDLATDPTVTGVTALVAEPVDLDTATLTVP